jgi:S1-C subfamily serine protease
MLIMVGFGVVGGFLAQQLFPTEPLVLPNLVGGSLPALPPINESSGEANQVLVELNHRSVVLIGPVSAHSVGAVATAFVFTNDGLIAAPLEESPKDPWVAFDFQGTAVPLQVVGRDDLFGLTYFRLSSGVFPPLDLGQQDPAVGQTLLLVSASELTHESAVRPFLVQQYALPPEGSPAGIQRVAAGPVFGGERLRGSPLFDVEGRVAGISLRPDQGFILPVSALQQSIERVTQNQRERHPWREVGLDVQYSWQATEAGKPTYFVIVITRVGPQSPAGKAGFKAGDVITAFGEHTLDWRTSTLATWRDQAAAKVTVWRAGSKLELPLTFPS